MTGLYRPIPVHEARNRQKAGEDVAWAEGAGYVVYERQGQDEGEKRAQESKEQVEPR